MKILIASAEVAPHAKVGGLADVAASLPKALRALGHDARIVMPAYGISQGPAKPLHKPVPMTINSNWKVEIESQVRDEDTVPTMLLDFSGHFGKVLRSEDLYNFGREDYLAFSLAVLKICEAIDWIPDVIMANDWHMGFLPVFLRERTGTAWDQTISTFTIHNLHYQGTFGKDTIALAGLDERLFTMDRLESWGGVNFLKSACVYADAVNTVSPTYAHEITTPEYGSGQWGLMQSLSDQGRLRGIINGIDYDFFDPACDSQIAAHYSQDNLGGKLECKTALQSELGIAVDPNVPILGMVSRLSDQKGYDILVQQAYGMLNLPTQLVVLGTGDPWAAEQLRILEKEWPDRVRFIERYDGPLAQRIYAGSDFFLMPSAFEPCGLGQMIACRYGTLPIVRKTGGLADTIFDMENGFVFQDSSARQFLQTIERAVGVFKDPTEFEGMRKSAMATDFSWTKSAEKYLEMFSDGFLARSPKTVAREA